MQACLEKWSLIKKIAQDRKMKRRNEEEGDGSITPASSLQTLRVGKPLPLLSEHRETNRRQVMSRNFWHRSVTDERQNGHQSWTARERSLHAASPAENIKGGPPHPEESVNKVDFWGCVHGRLSIRRQYHRRLYLRTRRHASTRCIHGNEAELGTTGRRDGVIEAHQSTTALNLLYGGQQQSSSDSVSFSRLGAAGKTSGCSG